MKDKLRNQNPLPQEDDIEMMEKGNSREEIDEEYFRINVPEGFEIDKHQDEYEYIWSCEPQKPNCPIESQHFTGLFYNKETREISVFTFIKKTLTSSTGTSRTFVKYIDSKKYSDVDEE
jgi:hypothetical protein